MSDVKEVNASEEPELDHNENSAPQIKTGIKSGPDMDVQEP